MVIMSTVCYFKSLLGLESFTRLTHVSFQDNKDIRIIDIVRFNLIFKLNSSKKQNLKLPKKIRILFMRFGVFFSE